MVSHATDLKFPKIDDLGLDAVIDKLKPKFQSYVGKSTELGIEFGFGIYVDATGLITTGGEIPGTKSNILFNKVAKSDSKRKLVGLFHAHPAWFYDSNRPSGATSTKPDGDVAVATSDEYEKLFFLVGTYIGEPPKGFEPIIHDKARSLQQYTGSEDLVPVKNPDTKKDAPKYINKEWQLWVVFNAAAKKGDF